jgi:hypothetical protein
MLHSVASKKGLLGIEVLATAFPLLIFLPSLGLDRTAEASDHKYSDKNLDPFFPSLLSYLFLCPCRMTDFMD